MYFPSKGKQAFEPSPTSPWPIISNRRFNHCQGHTGEPANSFLWASRLPAHFTLSVPPNFLLPLGVGIRNMTWSIPYICSFQRPSSGAPLIQETPRGIRCLHCLLPAPTSPAMLYSCVLWKQGHQKRRKTLFMGLPRLVSHIISIALRYTQLTTYANFRHHVWTKGYVVT